MPEGNPFEDFLKFLAANQQKNNIEKIRRIPTKEDFSQIFETCALLYNGFKDIGFTDDQAFELTEVFLQLGAEMSKGEGHD